MKKLLFLITFVFQFANAQTKSVSGEYLANEKSSQEIKLFLNEDKTFQISVFNGTYEIVNDSIVFTSSTSGKLKNSYDVEFTKKAGENKNVKFIIDQDILYNHQNYFLGIQNKANGEISYKTFSEYFTEEEIESYYDSKYSDNASELSFELASPHAIYVVLNMDEKANIEKYLISTNVSEIKIDFNYSFSDEIKLSGVIENTNSLKVFANGKTPIMFTNKKAKIESKKEFPVTKTTEKNWTFPGKKEYDDYVVDSAAVAIDTTVTYADYEREDRFEFKAKIEKNLKEALLNIKKDTAQYLFIYNNLKEKGNNKSFNNFIENYNNSISSDMYTEYNPDYDRFNFYLATKSDEAFFKKNNAKDKSILILNRDGKIIASSKKTLGQIEDDFRYDRYLLTNKLIETENAIRLSNLVSNKKTSIPDLTISLNSNYKDFTSINYYYNTPRNYPTKVIADEPMLEDSNKQEIVATDTIEAMAVPYENDNFKYYKSEVSEALLAEKLNSIFEYYNSKNIVNNDLVNILLGEISGNHTDIDIFKNENNTNNKQELKYINYILKYNEDQKNKVKIALVLNDLITEKTNNPDADTYNSIAYKLISYSGYNLGIIQNAVTNFNRKENGFEEANKLVDLYYNTLVNDKPLFENIDAQFNNLNAEIDYTMDWKGFKSQINSLLNENAWDIFEMNRTQDFQKAIKWSELSNLVEKDNPYSLDTLGQLYFAVGRKQEAITIQTKAVAIAKATHIGHEEFEKALLNMKK